MGAFLMNKQWYCAINDKQLGPVSESDLTQMLSRGEILEETLVWAEGMNEWQTFSSLKEEFSKSIHNDKFGQDVYTIPKAPSTEETIPETPETIISESTLAEKEVDSTSVIDSTEVDSRPNLLRMWKWLAVVLMLVICFVGYLSYNNIVARQNSIGNQEILNSNKTILPNNVSTTTYTNLQSNDLPIDARQPETPESWSVSIDKLFSSSGVPLDQNIARLIAALESPRGEGIPVSKKELLEMLSKPEAQIIYYKEIMKYATPVSKTTQKKEHADYAQIFMRENYQKAGLEFLRTQGEYLERAEHKYGVLKQDIVSILIWESGLGKFTGEYREFNVFLGQILFLDKAQEIAIKNIIAEGKQNPLDDPEFAAQERKRFDKRKYQAIENMVALLRYCKSNKSDPFSMRGSWGGAIGNVQFMPANLKYAVDGDGDGYINLSQWPDSIMSAANFLKIRGKYTPTDAGRKHALMKYNPTTEYVEGVLLLSEAIWQRHLKGE